MNLIILFSSDDTKTILTDISKNHEDKYYITEIFESLFNTISFIYKGDIK